MEVGEKGAEGEGLGYDGGVGLGFGFEVLLGGGWVWVGELRLPVAGEVVEEDAVGLGDWGLGWGWGEEGLDEGLEDG